MKRVVGIWVLVFFTGSIIAQVKFSNLDEVVSYADRNSLVGQQASLQQNISKSYYPN